MNKLLILLGIMLICIPLALAGSVERSFDVSNASPGDVIKVTLKLSPTPAEVSSTDSTTVLTDTPPTGWKISSLSDPKKCSIKTTVIGCLNSNEALTNTFTYKVTIPSDAKTSDFNGEFTFSSVDGDQTTFNPVTGSTTLIIVPKSVCGDGTKDSSESCDDGNTGGGDGCSSSCILETGYVVGSDGELVCASGYAKHSVVDSNEKVCQLKPGIVKEGDSCDKTPHTKILINGLICLDSKLTSCSTLGVFDYSYYCNPKGSWEICSIGTDKSGDDKYICEDGQWNPVPSCGDGALASPSEQCDDKNTENGDGCSATCTLETGYVLGDQTDILACAQWYNANSNDGPLVCVPSASILDLSDPKISDDEKLFLTRLHLYFQSPDVDVIDVLGFVSVYAEFKDSSSITITFPNINSGNSGISSTETSILKKLYQLSQTTASNDLTNLNLIKNVKEVVPWFTLQ